MPLNTFLHLKPRTKLLDLPLLLFSLFLLLWPCGWSWNLAFFLLLFPNQNIFLCSTTTSILSVFLFPFTFFQIENSSMMMFFSPTHNLDQSSSWKIIIIASIYWAFIMYQVLWLLDHTLFFSSWPTHQLHMTLDKF